MSGGRESGSLISKTVVLSPNFVFESNVTFSDFHSAQKIETLQTTKWSNENPKQEQVVVACVEFPDLLGKRLLTKNWAAQAEWSTESRSPRAPPEKPWDQLKLLLRCAQFLRWLDRVKVTADKDDGETHESCVDVMDIGKYIIYKMQLRRNAVPGM